jgi:dynein heavy chain, axonemal
LIKQENRANNRNFDTKDERTVALLKKDKSELLESNFDTDLLKLLFEVQYWAKIQTFGLVTFPLPLTRLLTKKDQLRVLRENVMLIVRDFNGIMHLLQGKEKALFQDHLSGLDKFIAPGITRLNWESNADSFVIQCRNNCLENYKKINDFQTRHTKVMDQFEIISSTILTKIKKGTLYELSKFMTQQEAELKEKQETFKGFFEVIRVQLFTIYQELFLTCKSKIQSEWLEFLKDLDKSLQKSLKNAVKNSLLDF